MLKQVILIATTLVVAITSENHVTTTAKPSVTPTTTLPTTLSTPTVKSNVNRTTAEDPLHRQEQQNPLGVGSEWKRSDNGS